MGAIHLVRHGQASFGTGDYDRLSELGHEQARLAGEDMAARGLRPDVVIHGGMRRQRETAEGLYEAVLAKLDKERAYLTKMESVPGYLM